MKWNHLLTLASFLPISYGQTMTVIQTASTNRPEIRVTVPEDVNHNSLRVVAEIAGTRHEVPYGSAEHERLLSVAAAAGPLVSLPVSHCMKSASFGSRLFVELGSQRSPDLSCPNQTDGRAAALRTEVGKLLAAALGNPVKGK